MKIIFLCELGLIALDESFLVVGSETFNAEERVDRYSALAKGTMTDELKSLMTRLEDYRSEEFECSHLQMVDPLIELGYTAKVVAEETMNKLIESKISLIVKAGLASSDDVARSAIRDYAMRQATEKLRLQAAGEDLQAIQAVLAVDELDKTINLVSARVREWYGLHFPELEALVSEYQTYAKAVKAFHGRGNFEQEGLESLGIPKKRAEIILQASRESKGSEFRPSDLSRITELVEESLRISSLRDKMVEFVEATMKKIAPNISNIAGPTIGARLIAKAGGLRRMAMLPASTVQLLGAEKALFRALKTGTRPPKHGLIFQHESIRTAPKWQRGKIARSLAGKIAIAARIDAFRGTAEESLLPSLQRRFQEIKTKYDKPRPEVTKRAPGRARGKAQKAFGKRKR